MSPEPDTTVAIWEAAARLARIQELHEPRRLDGDGFTLSWCRECRQNYPCPTAEAMEGRW